MSTVYTAVLADLGPSIVGGQLEPGTVVTLDGLQARYAVSRTVAREVVQVLASMHLVESRRRTGIRVLPADEWDHFAPAVIRWKLEGDARAEHLHQLSQLRAAVEPPSAALAAERADDDVRARLLEIAEEMEVAGSAGDLRTFLDLDVAFHRLLLTASGNEMFEALGDVVEEVLRGRTDHDLMPPEPKPEARKLHQMVAEAVARGDVDVAHAAMHAICVEVTAQMQRELPARPHPTSG